MVGVSGCLAGLHCRYDGGSRPDEKIIEMVKRKQALTFCPECLAGLIIPRTPSEITGGDGFDVLNGKAKVVSLNGEDRTAGFLKGAEKALEFCRKYGIKEVFLKSKSPSCAKSRIYDGKFNGRLILGTGVTAAFLMKNGIDVVEID